jgi:hypothetical protein
VGISSSYKIISKTLQKLKILKLKTKQRIPVKSIDKVRFYDLILTVVFPFVIGCSGVVVCDLSSRIDNSAVVIK